MNNKEIADILNEIGVMLEIEGVNPFKVRAYYNAARAIETYPKQLEVDIAKMSSDTSAEKGKFPEIKGVGSSIQEKILELINTGSLAYHQELKSKTPAGLFEMLRIPSVGPKKVSALYHELGIKSLAELEYACKENRLLTLHGFGQKSQEKILEGIRLVASYQERKLLSTAWHNAEPILQSLKNSGYTKNIEIAGSLRRFKETVKDIDLIASSDKAKELMNFFVSLSQVAEVTAKGPTKSSIRLQNGLNVDLRVVDEATFPYALHHFTGSKEHHVPMRSLAKSMGMKISEYGIFKGEDRIPCKDERDFYAVFGMDFIPPELRENTGEIEAAQNKALPNLVQANQIRGVAHVHSNWSDGRASIEDMANSCQALGYQYMILSDHSKAAVYANGLDGSRLVKQRQEIDLLNKKMADRLHRKDFHIFSSIEVDILADGSLDLTAAELEPADFVIAAVHSRFNLPQEQMTERIIKALSQPKVRILAHPTGRLLLGREPYQLDLDKIFDAALEHGVAMELNANPHRLDLKPEYLRQAATLRIPIMIGPDAHDPEGLKDMHWGVHTARRGWLEERNVLNCLSFKELADLWEIKL